MALPTSQEVARKYWTGFSFLTCTSFLKQYIPRGKSGFSYGILCFKRQSPQWKYKFCEPCRAMSPCTLLWKTVPGAEDGQAAEQWHSSCCQSPVGFGNVNRVCMWKNTELCFLTLSMLSTAPFQRVCSGNQDWQLVRAWHHASSSEPQAAKAQRLEKRKGLSSTTRKDAASKTTAVYTAAMLVAWNEYCWIVCKMSKRLRSSI